MGSSTKRNRVLFCGWCTKHSFARASATQNWHGGKQALKTSLVNLLWNFEIVGGRTWQFCESVNFKLHVDLLHMLGGCTSFSHFRGF